MAVGSRVHAAGGTKLIVMIQGSKPEKLTLGMELSGSPPVPQDFCKGAVPLSGMYDLAPVALSSARLT